MSIDKLTEFSELFRNIMLTLASGVGIYVALAGLKTWKRQKVWEQDQEVAQSTLAAIYTYRDALDEFRRPIFRSEEQKHYQEAASNSKYDDFRRVMDGMEPVFSERIQSVRGKSRALQSSIENCRFLWGECLPDCFNKIFSLEVEIGNFLSTYYSHLPTMEGGLSTIILGQLEESIDVLRKNNGSEDKRSEELANIVSEIEVFLRIKLGRGQ